MTADDLRGTFFPDVSAILRTFRKFANSIQAGAHQGSRPARNAGNVVGPAPTLPLPLAGEGWGEGAPTDPKA